MSRRMSRTLVAGLLVAGTALAAQSIVVRRPPAEWPALAAITPRQALDAALAWKAGGLLELRLDSEGGTLVYDVKLVLADGEAVEVQIDAGDGRVLGHEEEEDERGEERAKGGVRVAEPESRWPERSRIAPFDALQRVADATGGAFLGLELQEDDGRLVWSVDVVLPDGAVARATLDAGSGLLLELDDDEGSGEGFEDREERGSGDGDEDEDCATRGADPDHGRRAIDAWPLPYHGTAQQARRTTTDRRKPPCPPLATAPVPPALRRPSSAGSAGFRRSPCSRAGWASPPRRQRQPSRSGGRVA